MTVVTARELLVDVAGDDHALHTVMERTLAVRGAIKFICSCGVVCEVAATEANVKALIFVPMEGVA